MATTDRVSVAFRGCVGRCKHLRKGRKVFFTHPIWDGKVEKAVRNGP